MKKNNKRWMYFLYKRRKGFNVELLEDDGFLLASTDTYFLSEIASFLNAESKKRSLTRPQIQDIITEYLVSYGSTSGYAS